MNVYLIVIVSYFVLVTLASVLTRKAASRSAADYLIAGRNLGVVTCAVVVAAEWLGGMSTIGVSERAFKSGTMQPMLYNVSTALGMVIIGFTVASHYRRKNVHTVSEMIETIFGKRARNISAVAFLFAYIILAFVQLQTCASVIAALFPGDLARLVAVPWVPGDEWLWAVVLSSIVIMIYTYIGGMHALAVTGIIHVAAMFAGVGIATVVGLIQVDGFGPLGARLVALGSPQNFWNPFSGGWSYAWMLILGGVLGGMAGQASIQPIFAAKDASTARKAAVLSSLIIAPFGIMVAILGLIARTGLFFDPSTVNAKMVLPTLMATPSFIHPLLGGLALAGMLAAILSTVGPVNFAVVTIATKDIYQGILRPAAADQNLVATARRLVIAVNLVTIPLACWGREGAILDTAYISYGIRAIGAIVIVVGIYAAGWLSPAGVRNMFIGGTIAVVMNIAAKRIGLFTVEDTYVAVAAALFFLLLDILRARILRRDGVARK